MPSATTSATEHRVGAAQRTLERWVANPLLRRLLRTPLHRLASRWVVLVSYVGPKSGRRYTFPVAYATTAEPDALVVVTPRTESNWWKNFRSPMACVVWHRGDRRAATGEVVGGDDAARLLDAYADARPILARGLGLPDGSSDRASGAAGLAVVRFSFD